MNVLQVVALVTPDGAFGGPVRVAFNQAREIRRQGHDVTIAGACSGYTRPPTVVDGTAVHLGKARRIIPLTGVSGITSPAVLMWLFRNRRDIDIVHVHLGRDLVTMPAALLALLLKKKLVVQTHGMIDESDHPLAPVLDPLLTRRLLRRANVVLYLTPYERQQILQVEPAITSTLLPNAVPVATENADPGSDILDVLFLARLHERKRPVLFVEGSGRIAQAGRGCAVFPGRARRRTGRAGPRSGRSDWRTQFGDRLGGTAVARSNRCEDGASIDLRTAISRRALRDVSP